MIGQYLIENKFKQTRTAPFEVFEKGKFVALINHSFVEIYKDGEIVYQKPDLLELDDTTRAELEKAIK